MTVAHRDKVLELAPHRLKRTFTLTEAARLVSEYDAETIADLAALRPSLGVAERADIVDPIGQSPEVFAEVGEQIAELIPPVLRLFKHAPTPATE